MNFHVLQLLLHAFTGLLTLSLVLNHYSFCWCV